MAGSSVIGALRVSLGLDSAQFETGAAKAEKRAATMGSKITSAVKEPTQAIGSLQGALTGLAGALALKELAGATQRAFDYADAIQDLSDRTGASAKLIQEFRYAAQLSGSSVEVADEALGKFTKTLGLAQAGSDEQVKLFRSLGVTAKDFDGAFRQTLDGLAKLPSVQQRNAVALQLFGKSAATLTGLLGEGSAGFDELGRRAEELGIVLSDDLVKNAGVVNDKFDTMKMILNAEFASAITKNANAIYNMADALNQAAKGAVNFAARYPQIAGLLGGAAVGARFGGAPGALVGGGAGLAVGTYARAKGSDLAAKSDKELTAEYRSLIGQARGIRDRRTALGFATSAGQNARDLAAIRTRRDQVYAEFKSRHPDTSTPTIKPLGGVLPTEGTNEAAARRRQAEADAKRARAAAEREAEKAAADARRFEQQLSRGRDEQLHAQLDLTRNAAERVAIEQELLASDHAARLESIATDKDLTAERKKQLTAQEEETFQLRKRLQSVEQEEALAREALDRTQAANDNQSDVLNAQAGLARTAKERHALELRILDLQFEQLRIVQQAIIDSGTSSDQQRALAQDRLKTLDTLQGLARQRSDRDNAGPLAQYLDSIPKSAAEVNEALEGIEANGLSSLIDGLSNVEGGFKNLASVVDNVSRQIISSLLKIALQKGIAALFARVFPSSAASGITADASFLSSGISVSSLGGSGLPKLSGARAKGGPVIGGKAYLVGERGPEPFVPSRSGIILPNEVLGGGGGTKFEQHIHVSGAVDLATRTEVYRLASATKDATISALRDQDRRRA